MLGRAVSSSTPNDFQPNPDIRVAICNLIAGGVGITLTAGTHVIFQDLDWVPANHLQAEDRCYRLGQTERVTVEYLIDPVNAAEFASVMQHTRRARLRQGALSWGLFRDAAQPGRYLEYFLDETWVGHLRRLERFTAADVGLREKRLAFHLGAEPPRVQRFLGESID